MHIDLDGLDMRVLIINIHSTQNAGDAALLEMAIHTTRSVWPQAHITLAMNDPDTKTMQGRLGDVRVIMSFWSRFRSCRGQPSHWRVDSLLPGIAISLACGLVYRLWNRVPRHPLRWHELWAAYADADIVLSCPGNILADTSRFGLPFLISSWTIAFALLLGKPLHVLPQSIGPLRHLWERKILRLLYAKARTVMVREPISYRLANSVGLDPAHVHLVPDLAFAYPPEQESEEHRIIDWLRRADRPVVGVTVINRLISQFDDEAWERYESAMAGALSAFQEVHGGSIVFFPQVIGPTEREDDRIAAVRIVSLMSESSSALVVEDRIPPRTLKTAYGLTDLFVATRMHSAIFSVSMLVPTLLIEYMYKVRGLAEMLGLQTWLLELSRIDEDVLRATLFALWDERRSVRAHLAERVPVLISEARAVGQHLVGD